MRDKRGAEIDVAKPVGTHGEKDDDGAELDDEALETGIAPMKTPSIGLSA
jgi:hypothetical protein